VAVRHANFATHQYLLRTDNDYRRSHGLGPLPPVEAPREAGIGVDPQLFRRVDALNQERLELERRAKQLRAEVDDLQGQLTEQFAHAGANRIELDNRLGTLQRKLVARRVSEEVTTGQVVAALRADGLGHLVTPESYHHQTLSSWLRELEQEGKSIPPAVAEVIVGDESFVIGFTAARETTAGARIRGRSSSVLDGASER